MSKTQEKRALRLQEQADFLQARKDIKIKIGTEFIESLRKDYDAREESLSQEEKDFIVGQIDKIQADIENLQK